MGYQGRVRGVGGYDQVLCGLILSNSRFQRANTNIFLRKEKKYSPSLSREGEFLVDTLCTMTLRFVLAIPWSLEAVS